jgi:hypothetical protein
MVYQSRGFGYILRGGECVKVNGVKVRNTTMKVTEFAGDTKQRFENYMKYLKQKFSVHNNSR